MAKKKKPPADAAESTEQPPANQRYDPDASASLLGEAETGGNDEIEALFDDPTARPDPNARDADDKNNTAMHKAAANGDTVVMETLKKYRTRIDERNDDEDTPLTLAAAAGKEAAVKMLLIDWKANPNAADEDGNTALMKGAAYGNVNIVADLLAPGRARVNDKNNKGQSALSVASTYDVAELLLERGALPLERPVTPDLITFAVGSAAGSMQLLHNVAHDINYWLKANQADIRKSIGEKRFQSLNTDGDASLELYEVVIALRNTGTRVTATDTDFDFRASKNELIAALKQPGLTR